MRYAISYSRYSSSLQSEGDSLNRQQLAFERFCLQFGLTAHQENFVDKGKSGDGTHRQGDFGRFLSQLATYKGCVFVIEDLDRFSRETTVEVLITLQQVLTAGVDVGIVAENKIFTLADLSDTGSLLRLVIRASIAYEERQKKVVRGKANWITRRLKGLTKKGKVGKNCPFWLSVNEKGDGYDLNNFAPMVRRMFLLSRLGYGCNEISERMGVPSRTIKGRSTKIDVLGVLRNRAAIGELRQCIRLTKKKKQEVGVKAGYYTAVIGEDIFFRVQAGLNFRANPRYKGRKGKDVTNLFSGLITGDDLLPMHIKCENGGKKVLRRKTAGSNRTWDYAQLEFTLLRFMRELKIDDNIINKIDHTPTLEDLEKRIAKIKLRLETESDLDTLMDVLSSLTSKRKALLSQIEEEKGLLPDSTNLTTTQDILKMLADCSPEDRRGLRTRLQDSIRRLIEAISIEIKGKACMLSVVLLNGERRRIILSRKRGQVEYNNMCDTTGTVEVWRLLVA